MAYALLVGLEKEISICYLICIDEKLRRMTWKRWTRQQPTTIRPRSKAFVEAISNATVALMRAGFIAATIAQAGDQGGLSNLQIFETHLPLALEGGGEPLVTGHCS